MHIKCKYRRAVCTHTWCFSCICFFAVSPNNETINVILLTITGAFVGGPSNIIGTAITADLGKIY